MKYFLPLFLITGLTNPVDAAGSWDSHDVSVLTLGEAVYTAGCVPCHGSGGEGLTPDHPNYSSFDPLPADLSDPLFNSTEPATDWFLVVKYGGRPLGLSDQMPAYGGAYSDKEIDAVVVYLKTLADTKGYPHGDLNFLRPIRTIKVFPEKEALVISQFDGGRNSGVMKNTFYYANRFGKRFQYEIKASKIENSGSTELELGLKHAFFSDLEKELLLGGGLEVEFLFEDEQSSVLVPYLGFAKGAGDFTAQGNFRLGLPLNNMSGGKAEISAVGHWMHSAWPRRLFPGLEGRLVTPFQEGGTLEVSLIPQVTIGLTKGGHVGLAVGMELPLSNQVWDYRLQAFLVWDYADGALWNGW